jgi:hypothetical protein
MKKAEEILRQALTLNSKDYKFIQDRIDYKGEAFKNEDFRNFSNMMMSLFAFSDSPQGFEYWHNVIAKERDMQEDLQNHSHE